MWRRAVSSTDVQQAIKDYPSLISCTELSVANGFDDVKRCVDELITVIKASAKKSTMAPARENLKKFLTEKFSLKQKHSIDELSSSPRPARNTWRRGSVFQRYFFIFYTLVCFFIFLFFNLLSKTEINRKIRYYFKFFIIYHSIIFYQLQVDLNLKTDQKVEQVYISACPFLRQAGLYPKAWIKSITFLPF